MTAARRGAGYRLQFVACLALAMGAAAAFAAEKRGEATLTQVLDAASRRFEQHDYEGARRDYERATKVDPGSISAWRGLGWCYWQLGDHDRAVKVWNDIAKVQPNDPDILMALAQAHEYRQDWQKALTLYNRVIARNPTKPLPLMGRARVYEEMERHAPAEADLQAVLRLQPSNFDAQFMLAQVYEATGRESRALALLNKLARQQPDPKYLRALADVLFELDRPDDAIPYYQQALQRDPDNRGTVLGLSRAHARLHQYGPAMKYLDGYLASHADDAKVREELARFASGTGDFATAEKHLRILVRDHPDEIRWRVSLAQALQNAGKPDESTEIARAVLAAEPGNVPALELMYQTTLLHGRREDTIQWLERLAQVEPTPKRLNHLGDVHLMLGDERATARDERAAHAQYEESAKAFRQARDRARDTEPDDTEAALGLATALRLTGDYKEAIKVAEGVAARYPTVERARRELYEAYLAQGNYRRAEELLRASLGLSPGNVRLRQELARTRFQKGEKEGAIQDMKALLLQPIRPSVPVLLYHGISEAAAREDAMPLANFRNQMATLKQAGYEPITVQQLVAFYQQGESLPAKPVLITFDDARADSFRYADPVLEDLGFKATMFTPVAEVGKHGPFNAVWSTLRDAARSGRWDIQCHSYVGHVQIPLDAAGRTGAFFANRMWLAAQGRLETRDEFAARLDDDYRKCGETLAKELPGLQLAGYAYPFGEVGQRFFSNEPEALAINTDLARKYYQVGFVQDPAEQVTRLSAAGVLSRFEVPWHYTGKDLLDHLRSNDTYTSTQLVLADLYSWNNQFAEANAIFDDIARSGNVDQAALLARRGRIGMWQGDYAEARQFLSAAAELQPENRIAQDSLEQLNRRTSPRLSVDGGSTSDNRDRSASSVGPVQKFYLFDRVAWSLGYRRRQFADDNFDTSQLGSGAPAGPVDFRATGHEVETELAYSSNWRTVFAIAGGVAKFDDESSAQVFAEPRPFPLGSLTLSFPLGDGADVSLRAMRSYVNTAGAILSHLGSTGGEAQLKLRGDRGTGLDWSYTYLKYEDGNRRATAVAGLFQRIVKSPDIQIGYRLRYDDVAEANPLFYTPNGYMGNDAVLRLSAGGQALSVTAEGAYGAGREAGRDWQPQVSLLGTVRSEIGDRFDIYLNGGATQAADFKSTQVTAGFSLTF